MNYLNFPTRILLVVGSIVTLIFVIRSIRKNKVKIEDTLFWILLCLSLVVISIFPQIPFFVADLFAIASPSNLIFLSIIFILLVHQFHLSMKLSAMEIKFASLIKDIALKRHDNPQNTDC